MYSSINHLQQIKTLKGLHTYLIKNSTNSHDNALHCDGIFLSSISKTLTDTSSPPPPPIQESFSQRNNIDRRIPFHQQQQLTLTRKIFHTIRRRPHLKIIFQTLYSRRLFEWIFFGYHVYSLTPESGSVYCKWSEMSSL